MLYVLIAVLVFLDQLIKYYIVHNISPYLVQPVIEGFFSITHFANTGAAFSFLADSSWGIFVLTGISAIVSVILLFALYRLRSKKVPLIRFAVALLVSGTIGNMIDRVRFHEVVDYLMFTFGSYTFPIFNLADMCIVCGSIFLAVLMIFDKTLFLTDEAKKTVGNPADKDIVEGMSPTNEK